ncbi:MULTISPECIES: nitroreductase family protein [unclassified Caballeronia]|uniref:Acg family FMN-binding oxidoreductase n=1 Tax=unclassified Caballeronia TaxID=2646786 RepID=UPI0020291550|nr:MULTISPECIES: nitroreductase family protein [unclassified Caballeronia]
MLSNVLNDPWSIKEADLAPLADDAARLRFALHYAALAPSNHNAQPWRFIVDGTSVSLCADRTRALPVVDPYDRELIIGCGAALFNLRVALQHLGLGYAITLLPDHLDPDVLAQVRVFQGARDASLASLFDAMTERVTTREAFDIEPVPMDVQDELVQAATAEGVDAESIAWAATRESIAELVAQADREQFRDPRFRRELASWIHGSRRKDGMPAYSAGVSALLDFASPIASSVVRTFDLGSGAAAAHRRLVEHSPMLLCIGTGEDNPSAWLAAGQALERMLLTAVRRGLCASYLNQPIEIEALRDALRRETGMATLPQLLLRIGRGPKCLHTPRRAMSEMMTL